MPTPTLDDVTPLSFPIAFSQVREDPRLDLKALKTCGANPRVLMIASGGDSLAYLATQIPLSSISVLDANPAQIKLSRLKLKLLELPKIKRMQYLGHAPLAPTTRLQELCKICSELSFELSDLGPESIIASEGLDYLGRFERLFRAIQNKLSIKTKEALKPGLPGFIDQSVLDELKDVFHEHFSLPVLVSLFGEEATQNPHQNFESHFLEQTLKFLQKPGALHSPFIQQFLCGEFHQRAYAWHSLPPQILNTPIDYLNLPMCTFLASAPDESFDFIHLSNILDWLNPNQAHDLLRNVHRCLSPSGKVFIRQLNSSLDIRACSPFFNWHTKTSEFFLQQDQSFFYRQIHFGSKA